MTTEKFPTEALTNIAAFYEARGDHSAPDVIREALSAHAATESAAASLRHKLTVTTEALAAMTSERDTLRTVALANQNAAIDLTRRLDTAESALASEKRAREEAEANHAGCDAQVRELVSKALRAVRGQEAAESRAERLAEMEQRLSRAVEALQTVEAFARSIEKKLDEGDMVWSRNTAGIIAEESRAVLAEVGK